MTGEDAHFVDKFTDDDGDGTATSNPMPTLSKPGLLVMDVDSTLIDEEVIDELGEAAGKGEEIADVTERAMRGELEFCDALRARVALLEGLPVSVFDTVHDKLHFTRGALELIDTLHEHGWKVGVVSGGFHEVVDRLAAEGHIDLWIANRLDVVDGRLTGKVLGEIVCKTVKLHALRAWAERLGVPMSQTVAVGDGANDIPMIQAAGLGLAFCAKPKTQLAADESINDRDLRHVLEYLR
ncbi:MULTISPECIES: phosphoserine phosphatase SerB [Bifidobacterium]|uniref:phosphoserine phosphatase n=1 Tax=Bifidobacterium reuteri DSM 23975 TaxID=1437610 RepID=A0A087CR37_9BIFI|nr:MULTISPECIES: phosphoserine phosphatase SerB [Bifidobacterium]KFI85737.1 phosphoserine phosphatase SerB [Bifidobacterium reuteri DSM 23975]TPF79210.1 phosphoserine phosphatase [Bifidobacterium sp. UTCIF-1]TPF79668.1 phosphoserine phosphatase [Bifidobacterium sp. UTCIF-24]TPF83122.1 phosphoserine phosphatase [Bifidobacterium sp. UTCIF-3]TPF83559.1 phosphoserine phosphatase [Bifidobacterium sp. UTCIF-36]